MVCYFGVGINKRCRFFFFFANWHFFFVHRYFMVRFAYRTRVFSLFMCFFFFFCCFSLVSDISVVTCRVRALTRTDKNGNCANEIWDAGINLVTKTWLATVSRGYLVFLLFYC